MTHPLNILVVCRANVCRSPLAADLIARYSASAGLGDAIAVHSAGTDALDALPRCADARAWSASQDRALAAEVTQADLLGADLVLAADRESRAACAILDPGCRPHLFTLRQAAVLADAAGMPAAALGDRGDRLRWLVAEWDAERMILSGRDEESDDIADHHGPAPHAGVFEEIDEACRSIVTGFARYCAARPI